MSQIITNFLHYILSIGEVVWISSWLHFSHKSIKQLQHWYQNWRYSIIDHTFNREQHCFYQSLPILDFFVKLISQHLHSVFSIFMVFRVKASEYFFIDIAEKGLTLCFYLFGQGLKISTFLLLLVLVLILIGQAIFVPLDIQRPIIQICSLRLFVISSVVKWSVILVGELLWGFLL